MKQSDDLFKVVKSMSKSEKRYFKIFAKQHQLKEGNKYVYLFDLIDHQDQYDDKAITKKFLKTYSKTNMSSIKYYLNNLIMRSLRAFHEDKTLDRKIDNLFQDIHILYERGLFDQCLEILNQLSQAIIKSGSHLNYFRLGWWNFVILNKYPFNKKNLKRREQFYDSQLTTLEEIESDIAYQKALTKVQYTLYQRGLSRNKTDQEEVEQLISSTVGNKLSQFISPMGKIAFHQIHLLKNNDLRDFESFFTHAQAAMKTYSDNKGIVGGTLDHILAHSNYLSACRLAKKFNLFEEGLENMKKLGTQSKEIEGYIQELTINLELSYLIEKGDFEKGKKVIDSKIQLIKLLSGQKVRPHNRLVAQVAMIYFGLGDYSTALDWLNMRLKDDAIDIRQDLLVVYRLIHLVIHYELGNVLIIPYLIKSIKRKLIIDNAFYELEQEVLLCFKKIAKEDGRSATSHLTDLKKKLQQIIVQDEQLNTPLKTFDLLSWIESKISNKSFQDVVTQKFQSNLPN